MNSEEKIATQSDLEVAKRIAVEQQCDALRSWIYAANQFAWAHERDCPRRVSEGACTCGLDQFLGRPRPFIESYSQRIAELEQQLEAERAKVAVKHEALRYLLAEARAYMGVSCGCAGVTNQRCLQLRIDNALAALQTPEVKA